MRGVLRVSSSTRELTRRRSRSCRPRSTITTTGSPFSEPSGTDGASPPTPVCKRSNGRSSTPASTCATRGYTRDHETGLLGWSERSAPPAARQLAWVPQSAVRVSHSLPNRSRPTCAAKELCMSTESFADLGVSRAVISSLSRDWDHRAVRDPARGDRRCDRRPRRDREVAHRIGQDARLRNPAGRAHRRHRPAAGGARARADPRARDTDRR